MNDLRVITTKRGVFAIIDSERSDLLAHQWCQQSGGYFIRKLKEEPHRGVYLHREVNHTARGFHTDHINGDKRDNRAVNLRTASRTQNMNQNSKRRADNLASRFKGVSKVLSKTKIVRPWRAAIRVNNKQFHLGVFLTEKEAALAYNAAAKLHFGEFAKLNEV